VAFTEIHHTLSPAARPDPNVRLPLSVTIQRRQLIEQLRTMPDAVVTFQADPQPSEVLAASMPHTAR